MTNRRKFIRQTSIGIASILALRSEIFATDTASWNKLPDYWKEEIKEFKK